MSRARRLVAWVSTAIVLLVLAAAAWGYWSYSTRRARGEFRLSGKLVDVGGRRLHLICVGRGDVTIIFEPSMMGGASSSSIARQELSRHTRVCSYDRMGSGGSDPGPHVISAGILATDLERLLAAERIAPPYILVPSSIGGLVGELFARKHPDQVAGMVALDAANSILLERLNARAGWLGRTSGTVAACLLTLIELRATFCGMARGIDQTMRDFAAAPPLRPDLPLLVLGAETTENLAPPGLSAFAGLFARDRIGMQRDFSKRSTKGTWRVVPGSDHLIGNSQPKAVVDAVLEVLKELRKS